ncbi:MAG: plastocyanin/azurin family copper-binding protein [Planctomycetales bacterium]
MATTLLIAFALAQVEEAPAVKAAAVVEMTNDAKFVPAKVKIKVGETVEWKNRSKAMHTVTADPDKAKDKSNVMLPEGAAPFDSGKIRPGGAFSHTFTVAGNYKYFCIPHEAKGMIGEVEVVAADE